MTFFYLVLNAIEMAENETWQSCSSNTCSTYGIDHCSSTIVPGTGSSCTSLSVFDSDDDVPNVEGEQQVLGVAIDKTPQLTGPEPYAFAPAKSGDYVG